MLRIGFLSSDFNPMVLMLGEAEDLRLLAAVLRRFAREQADVRLDQLGFCAAPRTQITLTTSTGSRGVALSPEPDCYLWRLDAGTADNFADLIEQLAQPSRLAGSEILECSTEEEIPVKVSRGEYTDDFLRGEAA